MRIRPMLLPLIFLKLSFFLSIVGALGIMIQADTIVGQPSLVLWTREPSDGNGALTFDLRFVGSGDQDIGLASANIQAAPSKQFGTVNVVFPTAGSYRLVAVSGPEAIDLGSSNQVTAFSVPPQSTTSASPTSTSQPTATTSVDPTSTTAQTSTSATSTATRAEPNKNFGAIIGGTLGGLAFLGLLATLVIVFLRRRDPTGNKRWTFHRDMMVVHPTVPEIYSTSPTASEYSTFSAPDMEQGLPQDIPPAMRASPIGPRPLIRPPYHRDRPLPPAPLTARQENIVERMEQVRNQMMALERNPGPTQHIILDDMQKQMSWLQAQLGSSWARGLTDVTPLGFSRNLAS